MSPAGESHCNTGFGRVRRARGSVAIGFLGVLIAGLLVWSALAPGVASGRPTLVIDDDGQVAGAPITIRGSGFGVGENVILTVTHLDGGAEVGKGHEPWTVIAADGSFTATWSISPSDVAGDRFLARAVGGLSGPTNAVGFGRMAYVMTNQFDYAPDDEALIEGGGFRPGEVVTLHVIHTRGAIPGGEGHDPWTVTADPSGHISTTWHVHPDDSLGAEFLLHARGEESKLAATWAFMDAVCANPPPPDVVVPLDMPGVACPTNLNSCTANDVVTTVVAATPVNGDTCGSADDTLDLVFTIEFATTANQRFDLGFYISEDGLSIPGQTAQACAGAAPLAGAGDGNAYPVDCDSDLFLNLDATGHKEGDPDTCGDLQNNAGPVRMTFRATVSCDRVDINNNLLVPSCRVWEQNANHETACTSLAQAGTGSKCDCSDLSFAGILDPCVTARCDDGNPCTDDGCDSSSGTAVCDNDPVADGSACDDGDLCTEADTCQGGECTPGPGCDDGNPCTDDTCDPGSGCGHTNNNAPCDDGEFCNGDDSCSEGSCTHDGDPCTAAGDFCDEGGKRCVKCRDRDDCGPDFPFCDTVSGTCKKCGGDSDCTDPTKPFCKTDINECVECLDNAACENDLFCDGLDSCVDGVCTHDGDPCTAAGDLCDEPGKRCVKCRGDDDCPAGFPHCKGSSGTCTECGDNSDCSNPDTPVCNQDTNTCVECLDDAACQNDLFCDGADRCIDGVCTSDGDPCTAAGDLCDEPGKRCVKCRGDDDCPAGFPHCKGSSGTCTECGDNSDCSNPDTPVCNQDTNTCVECLDDAGCEDGNVCNGGETCLGNVCQGGTPLGCDDGNSCTLDSCNPAGGCAHSPNPQCEGGLTDTSFCPLPDDGCQLTFLQDPYVKPDNSWEKNSYRLNSSQPGQYYYNVFLTTPEFAKDDPVDLYVVIPYPWITQGANPIQVHDGVGFNGDCFVPSPSIAGCTVRVIDSNMVPTDDVSASGHPIVVIDNYDPQQAGAAGGSQAVHVSGCDVPDSGLFYLTIHLDYGLERTTQWSRNLGNSSDLTAYHAADGSPFSDGPVQIASPQTYDFGWSEANSGNTGDAVPDPQCHNKFKSNPGANGQAKKSADATVNPDGVITGARVQFIGPKGNVLMSTTTDTDGVFTFSYKHKGKAATYKIRMPDHGVEQSFTLKANGYALITLTIP
jgi:hypothetical protein